MWVTVVTANDICPKPSIASPQKIELFPLTENFSLVVGRPIALFTCAGMGVNHVHIGIWPEAKILDIYTMFIRTIRSQPYCGRVMTVPPTILNRGEWRVRQFQSADQAAGEDKTAYIKEPWEGLLMTIASASLSSLISGNLFR